MYEAHDSIFGGHNATQKTYLKILTSYYWPKMFQEIEKHKNFCLQCQQRKKSIKKKTPLAPLTIPNRPNLRVHADLLGPMITADSNKKFVLCITDAFKKYAVVTARLPIKRLKWWRMQFTRSGFQSSAFGWHKYTPMGAKNL
jgi:hypothetical protein